MKPVVDVLVVGAGLAGLRCARVLMDTGATVRVLEARDRVGGRTLSRRFDTATLDLGGQWLSPLQYRARALAQELSSPLFATYDIGRKVLDLGGRISTYAGTIPSLPPWALLDLEKARRVIDWLAAKVPTDDPMHAPDAARLDGMSLDTWLRRWVLTASARDVVTTAIRVIFGAEPSDLSMLHVLFYARSGGDLMKLVETTGGAQQDRFVRGAQSLSLGLAGILGDRVSLGQPVRSVRQSSDRVEVTAGNRTYTAGRVVLAIPPVLAGRIVYTPALPVAREQLTQRYPMGATVKCLALYAQPFWRAKGLSGELVCTQGPVSVTFDNSAHDGNPAALVAFVVGQAARDWSARDPEVRKRAVLDTLVRGFGPEAAAPFDYVEQDWSLEPWTLGCPVGVRGPGVLTATGAALRTPVGRIHWAGTETATEWNGYMEGALESGDRAAHEVLAAR